MTQKTLMSLEWSEPQKPCEKCRYDHVEAKSPLGEFRIEWKSWKEDGDDYCLYLNGKFLKADYELNDAKMSAQQHLAEMVAKLLPYITAPRCQESMDVQNLTFDNIMHDLRKSHEHTTAGTWGKKVQQLMKPFRI